MISYCWDIPLKCTTGLPIFLIRIDIYIYIYICTSDSEIYHMKNSQCKKLQFETYYHEITSCFVWNTERSFESVIHFITQLLSFDAFANPCENTTTSKIFIAMRIFLLATDLKVTTIHMSVLKLSNADQKYIIWYHFNMHIFSKLRILWRSSLQYKIYYFENSFKEI